MRTYFHSCPVDAEPESLLDPANQFTTPWGEPNHGPCDKCAGDGSVRFPSRGGLYRYLAERDADVGDRVLVELEGELSEDVDLDADAGALLVHPTRIVAVQPLDAALLD